MQIGGRLYYDKTTGNPILHIWDREGSVIETTVEQDFETFNELNDRVPETVGMIQLEYGQYAQDFNESKGWRVNLNTLKPEFSYPDPNTPETPEPVYQPPLTEQIKNLQEENTLLKAQNSALSDRADFIEDVIAEIASQVYQ